MNAARIAATLPMQPRSRLGVYEIVAPLGAGGMGEVYRARDSRLQRDVALKILPPAFLQDPERRSRFEREARVLASLNHPHIAAIYGIEDVDTDTGRVPVLVLELVEGRTLDEHAAGKPLPLDEAVAIARQIAEALEAAHERGIVHRDLKPANVKLTPEGQVKVLDFGLAKSADPTSGPHPDAGVSPTLTADVTAAGTIMGTAAYMAPEQARGKAVDRRADIWAFGAVFFEMLTGRRAFPGETASDTLAAILRAEPDWSALPPALPPSLRTVLHRCLDRDPKQRLQAIGEARVALSSPHALASAPSGASARRTTSKAAVPLAVLGGILLGGASMWLWPRPATQTAAVVRHLDIAVDELQYGNDRSPGLSPDGRRVLYASDGRLWTRTLTEFVSKEVPGSAGGLYPAWSPDGREVAFIRERKLWRSAIDGSEAAVVAPVPDDIIGSADLAWTENGNFVVVGSDTVGIYEISARDGIGREILPLDRQHESDLHEVSELPGGRGLLFTAHRSPGPDTIYLFSGGKRREVLRLAGESLRHPVYSPEGYLLFEREMTIPGIWGVRFSLDSLQTEGKPLLVARGATIPSVGADGTLGMVRRSARPTELVWIDRRGSVSPIGVFSAQLPRTGGWQSMALSPDEQRVAFATVGELIVYDLARKVDTKLTRGSYVVVAPVWTRDAARLLFAGFIDTPVFHVYDVSSNETQTPSRVLVDSDAPRWPCSISPDGKWLVFGQEYAGDLWIVPLDKSSAPRPLMKTPGREQEAHFSPDGKWIAYTSDDSGRFELYVRAFPIGPDRVQVSNGGAVRAHWSSDGRELVYLAGQTVASVKLEVTGARIEASPPQTLFRIPDASFYAQFVMARDGRFLFARSTGVDQISLILNWTKSIAAPETK